jgi:ferric iron reductase protein FhuF
MAAERDMPAGSSSGLLQKTNMSSDGDCERRMCCQASNVSGDGESGWYECGLRVGLV